LPEFNLAVERTKKKKAKIKNKRLNIDVIKNKDDYREELSDRVK
jgi:hypothetical protein